MPSEERLFDVGMFRSFLKGPKGGQGQDSHAANLVPNWDYGTNTVTFGGSTGLSAHLAHLFGRPPGLSTVITAPA